MHLAVGTPYAIGWLRHSEVVKKRENVMMTAATPLATVKVLVVDDAPDLRQLYAMVLRRAGADVRVAGSADEALEALATDQPDVLLSDLGMPERDGFQLIRTLRAREGKGRHTPAAALSAFPSELCRDRALRDGFDAFANKPLVPGALVQLVQERLRA